MTPSDRSCRLELKMTFAAGMVSVVRHFIETVAERLGVDEGASVGIAMAAHELSENVAKYGIGRHGTVRLDLHPDGEHARLILTVTNEAHPNHIDRAKQLFREMAEASDPMSHYFSLMAKAVPEGESGLGLARIQAEADMTLGLTVTGSQVSISGVSLPFTPAAEETA